MRSDIAVVIVNYGTADMAIAAVDSVLDRRADGLGVEIHLVDNASPGNDAAVLRETAKRWPDTVFLHLETENHGFGRGNNVVLRKLAERQNPPDKVYLLNPDARLVTNAVTELAAFLDAHPKAAVVGSSILHETTLEPVVCAFRFPGAISEFEASVSFGPVTRMFRDHLVAYPPGMDTREVDWVSGASMMARLDALREIGFFDPDYFLYFEEVDLMHRLKQRGWQVWHLADAKIIHVAGASTGVSTANLDRPPMPAYWFDSWRYYYVKQHGRAGALRIWLARWSGTIIGNLLSRLRGKPSHNPRNFASDFRRHVLVPLLGGSPRPDRS